MIVQCGRGVAKAIATMVSTAMVMARGTKSGNGGRDERGQTEQRQKEKGGDRDDEERSSSCVECDTMRY